MPLWKEILNGGKMAKAFGRATQDPGANETVIKIIEKGAGKKPSDAYIEGKAEGWMDNLGNSEKNFDKLGEMESDARLEEAMGDDIRRTSEAAASEKLRTEGKDLPLNDEMDDMALGMNRDDMVKEFQDALIDSLKRHGVEANYRDIVDDVTQSFLKSR